jgi:hypothetical protein
MSGQEGIAAREGQTALQDITDPKQIDEALRRLVEGEGHALIDGVDLTWQSKIRPRYRRMRRSPSSIRSTMKPAFLF